MFINNFIIILTLCSLKIIWAVDYHDKDETEILTFTSLNAFYKHNEHEDYQNNNEEGSDNVSKMPVFNPYNDDFDNTTKIQDKNIRSKKKKNRNKEIKVINPSEKHPYIKIINCLPNTLERLVIETQLEKFIDIFNIVGFFGALDKNKYEFITLNLSKKSESPIDTNALLLNMKLLLESNFMKKVTHIDFSNYNLGPYRMSYFVFKLIENERNLPLLTNLKILQMNISENFRIIKVLHKIKSLKVLDYKENNLRLEDKETLKKCLNTERPDLMLFDEPQWY